MTSFKRSESDWQGLVNEVSAALLKHDGGDDDDDDDDGCFHMALYRQPPELNRYIRSCYITHIKPNVLCWRDLALLDLSGL